MRILLHGLMASILVLERKSKLESGKLWSVSLIGALKSSTTADPLVSYGRHFGRTVHALTNVKALITNGILRMGDLAEQPEESFTAE